MPDTSLSRSGVACDANRGAAFAALITGARKKLGWTWDTLAFKSGVSRSTIARWERGQAVRPDPDQVRAVCRSLNIDQPDALVALGYLTADELAAA